jgi:drug/metabolite transporter (DMT)-like permease
MTTLTQRAAPAPVLAQGAIDATAIGAMTLLCLVWSLQQISLKAIADQISPMLMVALRSLIAAVLLVGLMRHRKETLNPSRWRAGFVVGALFGLEYLLVSLALQFTHASHVVVFLYTAPIFAALGLQARLPAERLATGKWVGILLAFAGIAVAFLGGSRSAGDGSGEWALLGDALALLGGAAWGATTVTIRCSTLASAPATETLLYQLLGAIAMLLPAAWWTGQSHMAFTTAVWAHLGFQSLVVSFASFLTWCWLLRRYLASQLGVFSFLTPLFGVLLGWWLLDERLDASFVVGGGLVLAGIGRVSLGGSLGRSQATVLPQSRAAR